MRGFIYKGERYSPSLIHLALLELFSLWKLFERHQSGFHFMTVSIKPIRDRFTLIFAINAVGVVHYNASLVLYAD